MSDRCRLPTGTGAPCGRKKMAWTDTMHPICPTHDRVPCPKCHVALVDGNAERCPSCGTDVRISRKDLR